MTWFHIYTSFSAISFPDHNAIKQDRSVFCCAICLKYIIINIYVIYREHMCSSRSNCYYYRYCYCIYCYYSTIQSTFKIPSVHPPCHKASLHCPSSLWVVLHWPDNQSRMVLIAVGCLASLSPGAKGNNGVMGKILQAVTSFGFRMCFTGRGEGGLYGVCVLLGDRLKKDGLSEFEDIHQAINYPLCPLSGAWRGISWPCAPWWHIHPAPLWPCLQHHLLRWV